MDKSLRESRIDAIKILYSASFLKEDCAVIAQNILDENDEVALKLALNVEKNKEEIDSIIRSALENYTISRLNVVDRIIIELATYEMMSGTPCNIAINEALEITKIYTDQGDKKAVAFNNKVLDNIKRKLLK